MVPNLLFSAIYTCPSAPRYTNDALFMSERSSCSWDIPQAGLRWGRSRTDMDSQSRRIPDKAFVDVSTNHLYNVVYVYIFTKRCKLHAVNPKQCTLDIKS